MKTDWEDKREKIKNLNLDLQNPRVPMYVKEHNDVGLIRNYLIEKEGVIRIAESIAVNGYHRSVTAIACKENGKLVVLDGNRRLAACQLLMDPTLAPTAHRKHVEALSKQCDTTAFETVKVTIAPSRKDAEKEIWDIHVNPLLKPWEVLQKLRMYRNLIEDGEYDVNEAASDYRLSPGDFKNELAKLHFFEAISSQNPEAEKVLLESGFNKIDRLILSKNGKLYLEYSVNDDGKVIAANPVDHQKKLKALIPYITEPNRVSAQATHDWIKENVFAILDPKRFGETSTGKQNKPVKKTKKKRVVIHPKCFVIMPLSGLDSVYKVVQSAWQTIFGKKARIYNQMDDKSKGAKELIDKKILKNISSSTVVVGILSMGSKEKKLYECIPETEREEVFQKCFPINVNVALEVGYSIRCADEGTDALKDCFLIADNCGDHSAYKFAIAHCFDLGHREIIPYTETELDKLKLDLIEYFKHFKEVHNL